MRGPGPACRAKQMAMSPQVQSMLAEIRAAKVLKVRAVITDVFTAPRRFFGRGRLRASTLRATMAAFPTAGLPAVIIAMNGPSHDAAALCNSRRLPQSRPAGRGLVQGQGSCRHHRVQPAVRLARGRRRRAEGFRDHLRDARAHAVSAHAVCGPAQAEAPDHLGHAQRRDRYGSRQGPQGGAVRDAMGPRSDRAADHGPDPGTDPQYRPRERADACRRTAAEIRRHGDRGPNAWRDRPRQARHQGVEAGAGLRHERDRLESRT